MKRGHSNEGIAHDGRLGPKGQPLEEILESQNLLEGGWKVGHRFEAGVGVLLCNPLHSTAPMRL